MKIKTITLAGAVLLSASLLTGCGRAAPAASGPITASASVSATPSAPAPTVAAVPTPRPKPAVTKTATSAPTLDVVPETGEAVGPGFDTEGSVRTKDGSFVQYPDGTRIDWVSIKDVTKEAEADPDYGDNVTNELAGGKALVTTIKISNTGASPVPVDVSLGFSTLYEGQNRTPVTGSFSVELAMKVGEGRRPTRLMPGTSYEFSEGYVVHDVSELIYTVNAMPTTDEGLAPFTFTGIGKHA